MEHFSRSDRQVSNAAGSQRNSIDFTRPLARSRSLNELTSSPTRPPRTLTDFTRLQTSGELVSRTSRSLHSPTDFIRQDYEASRSSASHVTALPRPPRLPTSRLGDKQVTEPPSSRLDIPSRSNDGITSIPTRQENHRLDLIEPCDRVASSESSQVDTQKILRQLGIRPEDYGAAQEQAQEIYKHLQTIHDAKENLDEARKALLALSPKTKPGLLELTKQRRLPELGSRIFFPPGESLNGQVVGWEAQMKIAQPDRRTWSGFLHKKFIEVNKVISGPLNTRVGKFGLALALAGVGSCFPAVIAGRFLASSYFANLASSYIGNIIFASNIGYPSNVILDSIQWQVTSVGGYYAQISIEQAANQSSNATIGQTSNFTTRQLGDFLAGPLVNMTNHQPTTIEIGDLITNHLNSLFTKEDHPISIEKWNHEDKMK